ncbi:MAG: histone deacetylase [Acidobacteria bacterium]|nr:MAG: histone deacetylase [Acidobacteriota bacterium]
MAFKRWFNRIGRKIRNPHVSIWYHPDYRLPVPSIGAFSGMELRRADYVVWEATALGFLKTTDIKTPTKIPYHLLAKVHSQKMLDSLASTKALARTFSVQEWEIPVDQVLRTMRLACQGTLKAARAALHFQGPTFNLLGGFHHAHIDKPGGYCLVNDIAVTIAQLRAQGFHEHINILDLDAHPPDGTADCLYQDPKVWIGSLSGSDWGELPGVDETVLPEGCSDQVYSQALALLLKRAPQARLTFVIAGGDIIKGDRHGLLGLTLEGARIRDRMVARHLKKQASVWVPGGGYHKDSWRVLTGTVLTVLFNSSMKIPKTDRPLKHHYRQVFHSIDVKDLHGQVEPLLTEQDVEEFFGIAAPVNLRFLDYYTTEGIELALFKYGILTNLRRLGYSRFKIEIRKTATGDMVRLKARSGRLKQTLFEAILRITDSKHGPMLFIDWFTLRNPREDFKPDRPKLPGQEVPGLGMSKEAIEIMFIMAKRLELKGLLFKPSWYHIAYTMRHFFQFSDKDRHARFLALIRDTKNMELLDVTLAMAENQVLLNGKPYQWEAMEMNYYTNKEHRHNKKECLELSKAYSFEIKKHSDTPRKRQQSQVIPDWVHRNRS